MANISLCMIVQDEEECLVKNLRGCIDFVDEIILLDGGSEDNTIEIAREIPKVKLYEFPFDFHFANQKNRCQEKANCDWILWKDADETFEPDVLSNLQRLTIYEPYIQYDAFAFARKTYVDGLLINLFDHDYQVRFWQNGKNIRYDGKLHEGVTGFENMMYLNVWIIHEKTGHMQQKDNELYWNMGQETPPGWEKQDGKWIYNRALAEEQIREAENDTDNADNDTN